MSVRTLSCLLLTAGSACSSTTSGTGATTARVTGATTARTSSGSTSASTSTSGAASGATTGATTATPTTGAGTGTTGGSTTGGSGSTTGGVDCTVYTSFYSHPLTDCADGQSELLLAISDFCPGAITDVTISDYANPSVQATALPGGCGYFYFCVPASMQTITPYIVAPGFFTTIVPPVTVSGPTLLNDWPGLGIACSAISGAFASELTDPPYQSAAATVIVSTDDLGAMAACSDQAGWVFQLTLADGGVANAGLAYSSGSGFDPTATSTDADGTALFYDLNPALGQVFLSADNPGFDDAGIVCGNLTQQVSYTLPLVAGDMTFIPFQLP